MKRKGRKSKTLENSNGVDDRQDQNGEASDRDEQDSEQEDKRRKSNKRKSASKKVEEEAEEAHNDDSEEPEDKKKKSNKRKSASRKADEDTEEDNEDSEEPEDKKKKSGKRKSNKKAEENDEDEPQYEVEQVLDEKNIQGVRHYLIRWKGYEPESDTWEPESTLNCPELIAEYKAKQKKKGGKSKLAKKKEKGASVPEVTWDENEDFEVDRILDVYFKRNGQREFLVSWKGYPQSQNSWEPEENMDCKDLIKKFMEKVEKAKISDQRELRIKRTHTDRLTLLSDAHLGRRLSKRNQGKQRIHYHDAE